MTWENMLSGGHMAVKMFNTYFFNDLEINLYPNTNLLNHTSLVYFYLHWNRFRGNGNMHLTIVTLILSLKIDFKKFQINNYIFCFT